MNRQGPALALVTGVSHGIGAAIARRLSADGHSIVGVSRDRAALSKLRQSVEASGALFHAIECDIGGDAGLAAALKQLNDNKLCPTIVVNNAAYGGPLCELENISGAHWDQVMHVSVRVPLVLAQLCVPFMRAAGGGRIINIGSVLGEAAVSGSLPYVAAKHALTGVTRALAVECGSFGITANVLAVGYVDYQMTTRKPTDVGLLDRIPAGRFATPIDVAECVGFLCRPAAAYINGASIAVDGGLLANAGSGSRATTTPHPPRRRKTRRK